MPALYTAFIADNDTGEVLFCSSPDGKNWDYRQDTKQSSHDTPALALFGSAGFFTIAFTANNPTNDLLTVGDINGDSWAPSATVPNQSSKLAPSLAIFKNQLRLAFVANNDSNQLLVCHSADDAAWSPSSQVTGQTSKFGPSMAVYQNELWLAFVANNDTNQLLICHTPDGTTWTDADPITNQSSQFAPSLTATDAGLL